MDCQTELRISTVTYFSTSRAPQSSGPFLPFPLPFLPMTRLRGPRWTVTRPPRKAKRRQPKFLKASFQGPFPHSAKVGTRWIPLTKSQPRTGHHCTRRSVVGAAQRTVAVKRHRGGAGRETHGTHGTHGLGTDAHGSHRRTSQAHNHPATHECRDATELGVAARDGVEASLRRARDGSLRDA